MTYKNSIRYSALFILLLGSLSLTANHARLLYNIKYAFECCTNIREIYIQKPFSEAHIQGLSQKVYVVEVDYLCKQGYTEAEAFWALPNKDTLLIRNISALIAELNDHYDFLQQIDAAVVTETNLTTKDALLTLITTTLADLNELKKYVERYVKQKQEDWKKEQKAQEEKRKKKRKQREKEEQKHYKKMFKADDDSLSKKYTYQEDTCSALLEPFNKSSLEKAAQRLTLGLWPEDRFLH
jgi:cytidylate kinase